MLRAASLAQSAWRIAVGIFADRFLFAFDDLLLKVLQLSAYRFLSVVSSPVVRSFFPLRTLRLCGEMSESLICVNLRLIIRFYLRLSAVKMLVVGGSYIF